VAKLVNLRRARKQRARLERQRQADANAALHGISKDVKDTARQAEEQRVTRLDSHRLDRNRPDD